MTIIQQIGLPFEEINSIENSNLKDFAVIIVSSESLTKKEAEALYNYTVEGGAVISEAENAKALYKINLKSSSLEFLYSESDKLFINYLVCDLYCNSKIPVNSVHLENQDKIKSVLTKSVGKGIAIVFPERFSSLIHRSGSIRKNFYSPFSNDFTSEQVSKVSKGIIRLHIQKALEYLFHKRGLPFVHLWFFPSGARNIFSFRVDTDMGTNEEINSLNGLLQNYSIPAAWFVETRSAQSRISLFSKLNKQEISCHCYRHKTFLSYKKNEEDIAKGLKILESIGIEPAGYAAPYGKWNKTIGKAIDNFNFLYSSEFGFAYDSLPLFPYYNSSFSKTLQIPIHPVSAGRLHWGGHSEEKMAEYFLSIIEQKLFFNEPVILYTHPFEKRLRVFEKVFERIIDYNSENVKAGEAETKKIHILTFSEYAEWWKKRLAVNWSAEVNNGKVFISANNSDESIKCRVVYPSGEKFILSTTKDEAVKVEEEEFEFHPSFNPHELRKRTFKMIKYDIIAQIRKLKQ